MHSYSNVTSQQVKRNRKFILLFFPMENHFWLLSQIFALQLCANISINVYSLVSSHQQNLVNLCQRAMIILIF